MCSRFAKIHFFSAYLSVPQAYESLCALEVRRFLHCYLFLSALCLHICVRNNRCCCLMSRKMDSGFLCDIRDQNIHHYVQFGTLCLWQLNTLQREQCKVSFLVFLADLKLHQQTTSFLLISLDLVFEVKASSGELWCRLKTLRHADAWCVHTCTEAW